MTGSSVMSVRASVSATLRPLLNKSHLHAHATSHRGSPLPPMPIPTPAEALRPVIAWVRMRGPAGVGSEARLFFTIISGGSENLDKGPVRILDHKGAEDAAEGGDGDPQGHVFMQEAILIAATHAIGAEGNVDRNVGIIDAVDANGLQDTVVFVRSAGEEFHLAGLVFVWPGRHCGLADGDLGSHGDEDMGYVPSSCLALPGEACARRPWDLRQTDRLVMLLAMCASGALAR